MASSLHNQQEHTASRTIRVFISSTFRDMQSERDELLKYVFPRLKELCTQRRVTLREIDLRWGITEADATNGKVIPICLEEIDQCRPYFIGLLGERYGWVPDQLPDTLYTEYPWLKEYTQISVTEMEIIYGVFHSQFPPPHAFFYFRSTDYLDALPTGANRIDFEPENVHAQAKLAELKGRIQHSTFPVRHYVDPQHAGQLIYEDFRSLIEQLFPDEATLAPFERERRVQYAFAETLARIYVGRQRDFDRLDEHVANQQPPLVVVGAAGIGKSALLATWLQYRADRLSPSVQLSTSFFAYLRKRWKQFLRMIRWQKDEAVQLVVAHFVGATLESTIWSTMLQNIITEFQRHFDLVLPLPEKPGEIRTTFANWLQAIAHKGKVILLIDGLDQLEDRQQALDLGWLPEQIPVNVRLIMTTSGGPTLDEIRRRGWLTWEVQSLQLDDRKRFIDEYLHQYGKALDKQQQKQILAARQAGNPLFLRTLLEELRIFGQFESLQVRIANYTAANSIEALFVKLLTRLEEDYEAGHSGLVSNSLGLLWAARQGLSETELLEILGEGDAPMAQAVWSPLYLAIKESLIQRSGLLTFFHQSLRQAVETKYLVAEKSKGTLHQKLADYFGRQPLSLRKIEELPWHLAAVKAWSALYVILADPVYVSTAWSTHQFEIKAYWALLLQNSSYSLADAYAPVVERPAFYKDCVWQICQLLGDTGNLRPALQLSLFLADEARSSNKLEALQATLSLQATFLKELGEYQRALRLLEEQEQLCRRLANEVALAASLGNQGVLWRTLARPDEALRCFKAEEELCRQNDDSAGLSTNLGNQAIIAVDRDQLDEALTLFQEQEKLCRQLGDIPGLQKSRSHQGVIYQRWGNLTKALALQQEAVHTFRQFGDLSALQAALGRLAQVQRDGGAYDQAMDLLDEKERICRQLGDPASLVTTLLQAGELFAFQLKQPAFALERYLKEAEQLGRLHDLVALQPKVEALISIINGKR